MHHAMLSAFANNDVGIIIGSDIPGLDSAYLHQAILALQKAAAVFGPAEDGGYVLVGLRQAAPGLFAGVEWGSSQVMAQTRERLAALALPTLELPVLWDLDRPEDLARLPDWRGE
jgi:glycosyltransferase A (GT-A) superfamily protein (DUF2064 family)